MLKEKVVSTPIMQPPDQRLPLELMCDTSDFATGVVLGQRKEKKPYVICYASSTLDNAQMHYTTTKKKLLTVVFGLQRCSQIIQP